MLKKKQQVIISIGIACIILLIGICCTPSKTSEVTRLNENTIRQFVEGTWELEAWNLNGRIISPPEGKGYILFHDGVVMFTIYRTSGDTTFTRFGNAVYEVTDSTWGYRYDHNNYIATLGERSDTVINNGYFSWKDFRMFDASFEDDKLILERNNGQQRFELEKDKQTYLEKGNLVRVWRRVGGD